MDDRTFARFAAGAAGVVGLSILLYGIIWRWVVPPLQKETTLAAMPAVLAALATTPGPLQVLHGLVLVGGLAASAPMVALYLCLRPHQAAWALWALVLGLAVSLLTALDGAYRAVQVPLVGALYTSGDAGLLASASALWSGPSPLNPGQVSVTLLPGLWLLVTGALLVQTGVLGRGVGYLALVGGLGLLGLFVSTVMELRVLIVGPGTAGTLVVGPLFWWWLGYELWRRAPARLGADQPPTYDERGSG